MNTSQEMPIQHILNSATPGDALAKAVSRHEDWLPSFLVDADTVPAGPLAYHSGSVLKHITRCMDAVAGDPLTVWMALAHDAGKLTTPSSLWPHHYGHEIRGRQLVAVWTRQLNLSDDYARAGAIAALLHMKAGRYMLLRPGKKYDLLKTVAESGFFYSFWKVVDADTKSIISTTALADWLKISEVSEDDTRPEYTRQRRIALLKTETPANA